MPHLRSVESNTRPGSGIASRYRALLLTHNSLEEKLSAEHGRPMPDMSVVQRIKRRKLLIKNELAAIERLFDAMDIGEDAEARRARASRHSGATSASRGGQFAGDGSTVSAARAVAMSAGR